MDDSTTRLVRAAEISLGADARSARAARLFLATTLDRWDTTGYDEDAVLLLSELVTNATLHAKTEIVVRIELLPEFLRLAVTDGSPRRPVVRHYSDHSTTGRGLALVSSLALRWGIDPHPGGSKTVWAEVGSVQARLRRREAADAVVDPSAVPDRDEATPAEGHGRDTEGTTTVLRTAFLRIA